MTPERLTVGIDPISAQSFPIESRILIRFHAVLDKADNSIRLCKSSGELEELIQSLYHFGRARVFNFMENAHNLIENTDARRTYVFDNSSSGRYKLYDNQN